MQITAENLGPGLRHIHQEAQRYGTSMYSGVLCIWDEDKDERVHTRS